MFLKFPPNPGFLLAKCLGASYNLPDLVAATGPMVGLGVAERQPASGDGRRSGLAIRGPARSAKPSRLSPGPLVWGHRHPMRSHSAFTKRLDTKKKGVSSMHQLVILTALTATSGLFGGHGHGGCGRPRLLSWCAPKTACASPCGPTYHHAYAPTCATCPTAAPAPAPAAAPAPQAAPAPPPPPAPPAPTTQVAPAAPRVARAAYYYPAYYRYPATQTCPNGNCPRR